MECLVVYRAQHAAPLQCKSIRDSYSTMMRRNFFFPTRTSYEAGLSKSSLQVGSFTAEPFISNPPCLIMRSASDVEGTSSINAKSLDHFSRPLGRERVIRCSMSRTLGKMTNNPAGTRCNRISFISAGAWRSRKTRLNSAAVLVPMVTEPESPPPSPSAFAE